MRRAAVVLVLTAVLATSPGVTPAKAAGQAKTDSLGQLQIWTVNIRVFTRSTLEEGHWKKFVDRITNPDIQEYMPDIVVVQEISKSAADDFADHLAAKAGASYRWSHAKARTNTDTGAGTWKMVVWRAGRLELATGSTTRDVLRWAELRLDEETDKCEPEEALAIAVRLKDKQLKSTVTAGSVHFAPRPPGSADKCNYPNMRRAENRFDRKWPKRDLTVIGGDFNNVPQDAEVGEEVTAGREPDPDCWYRNIFGEYAPDDQDGCDTGPLSYYDAVYLAHSNSDGTTTESICEQWTHSHEKGPLDSNSCQDADQNGHRDKGRIDYLWLRWEDDAGVVERPSLADARARVPYAGADQIDWVRTRRYSDHRGVGARVQV